jgi:hypothetical protein
MKRITSLAIILAILLPAPTMAQGQRVQPSENDIFALYCFGVLQYRVQVFDRSYPGACPTGQERGCDLFRETGARQKDNHERARRYIIARGYLAGAQTGIQQQLMITVRSGEGDAQQCSGWLDALAAGLPPPSACERTDRCDDLSRLPM